MEDKFRVLCPVMWVDSLCLAVKGCSLTLPLCLIQHVFIVDELTRERERDRLDGWGGPRAMPPPTRLGRRARGDCQDARRWDRAVAYTGNLLEQFRTRAGACGGLSEKHWASGRSDAVSHCVIGGHRRFSDKVKHYTTTILFCEHQTSPTHLIYRARSTGRGGILQGLQHHRFRRQYPVVPTELERPSRYGQTLGSLSCIDAQMPMAKTFRIGRCPNFNFRRDHIKMASYTLRHPARPALRETLSISGHECRASAPGDTQMSLTLDPMGRY